MGIIRFIKSKVLSEYLVLGDSHSSVFNYINNNYLSNVRFRVRTIGGATAFGLANPNSKTNAFQEFKIALKSRKSKVIFILGEVDTGYLIWWRAQKYDLTIEDQFEESLKNYIGFIDSYLSRGLKDVILVSAPLPTIKDNFKEFGKIAGERSAVKATQAERTDLTIRYNKRLKSFCDSRGLVFLDVDKYMLDDRTKLIKSSFLNSNPLDHHCDNDQYASAIIKELIHNKIVNRLLISRQAMKVLNRLRRLSKDRGLKYWETRAKKFGKVSVLNLNHSEDDLEKVTDKQISEIFPHLEKYRNVGFNKALDYGCGIGRFSGMIADTFNCKVDALDPIKELRELAPNHPMVSYHGLEHLKNHKDKYDFIWVCLVLGGLQEKEIVRIASLFKRITHEDSVFCLIENTTPGKGSANWRFRSVEKYQHLFQEFDLSKVGTYQDLNEEISIMLGKRKSV